MLVFHADLGLADGGFLGVSVFFTLSGFLITSLFLTEHHSTGRVDLRAFYERRVRRLMPAAHLCVAAVLAAGVWWAATQRRDLPGDAIAAVANVANWRFALAGQSYQDLFIGAPSPLAHFWSLAIEEQCYLVLPVVAAWAMRRGGSRPLGVVLTALVAASLVSTLLTSDTNLVYNATHTRAGELLIGAVAAVVAVHVRPGARPAAWASAAGLTVLGLLTVGTSLQQRWLYRGGFLLVAVVSACTVVCLTVPHAVSRLLGSRPFTAVGRRSYGVYLYHWPLFLLLTPERVGLDGWELFGVRLAATAVMTVCSFALIERPVRDRTLLRGRRVLVGSVSFAAVAVAVAAVVVVPAPRFDRTEQLLAMGDGGPITFTDAGVDAAGGAGVADALSARSGPPRVLLLGSNAVPAEALRQAGFEVTDGTTAGCPISGGAEVRMQDATVVDVAACVPVLDHWTRLLHDTSPDVVVLAVGDIDAGLTRMPTDFGFPAPDDVPGTARLLAVAEQSMRRVVGALDTSEVPLLLFDRVVMGGERPINRLALGSVPPRRVFHSVEALVASVEGAVGDGAGVDHRVLVVGDSTSLDMAQAISDAGAGRVAVQWAGANGCPFVSTEATRASSEVQWEEGRCPDYTATVPGLVAQFRPDTVMVVLGPTELQQHRYPGDPTAHVSGDAAFVRAHDAAMASFLGAVGDVPVLVTDGPSVQPGVWATQEMADPQRVGAWNLQVARWDQASPQVITLPYAATLAAFEWEHGPIRADGVHPDVQHLTTLVVEWLMPFLDAIAGEWGSGDTEAAGAAAGVAAARLLVIGDSTSLMAARALADGSDGSLVVRWAGQEGCPMVRAGAARPARDSPWRELTCVEPRQVLPAVIEEFQPDAVLVVLGAMELMELRGLDGSTMLPGDAAFRAAHDEALGELLGVVREHGVRLLFADSPPLGVGSFSTFEMADPARAEAFNRMLAGWDTAYDDVSVLAYAGPIQRFEAEHGSIRPDGSHPSIEPLTGIARVELVPALLALLEAAG